MEDSLIMNNKGNTMVDMLLALLITMGCMCLTLNRNISIQSGHYDFLNKYLVAQSKALRNRENVMYEEGLYFNENGHVNRGGTFYFDNHKAIVHLGNGYVTYE